MLIQELAPRVCRIYYISDPTVKFAPSDLPASFMEKNTQTRALPGVGPSFDFGAILPYPRELESQCPKIVHVTPILGSSFLLLLESRTQIPEGTSCE